MGDTEPRIRIGVTGAKDFFEWGRLGLTTFKTDLDLTVKADTYHLYGLTLRSEVSLPCPIVEGDRATADVELRECAAPEMAAACDGVSKSFVDDGFWQCRLFEDEAAYVCWKEHFEFVVSANGRRVLWRKLQEVPAEVFFTYFLGQVLSFCLLARGIEPLHATAIVVNGEAVAFLGDCGQGKSTLAATFLKAGYPLLTDDVLVLDFRENGVVASPSQARIKLNPDSADALFERRRAMAMNKFTSKMIFPLQSSQHVATAVRLSRIYVLPETSSECQIELQPLYGRDAFLSIVKNTFNASVLTSARLKRQFAFAGRLASLVSIKRLSYPRRLDLLPRIAATVLADLAEGADSQ